METESIFDQENDLNGNPKEIWMIHDLKSFEKWYRVQHVSQKIRIENITLRNKQGGSLTKQQAAQLIKWGSIPGVKITTQDMYDEWLDMIQSNVRWAVNDGSLQRAVEEGRLTAADAAHLIQAANIKNSTEKK